MLLKLVSKSLTSFIYSLISPRSTESSLRKNALVCWLLNWLELNVQSWCRLIIFVEFCRWCALCST